jgi:3-methylfumaryl-CoA hydratase
MNTVLTTEAIGHAAVTTSQMPVEHAQRVAAVLDAPDQLLAGDALPLLWHWAFFLAAVPTAELGADGHPALPTEGPASHLPRRVWAGGRLHCQGPLVLGEPATRRSSVVHAERKHGRSGELLIVTARHEIEQRGNTVLTEEQDLVYRAASHEAVNAPGGAEHIFAPERGWNEERCLDAVALFRFSAVTFNSHRIHYDLPYATGTEHYSGLVVHGPLTAMLLAESARRRSRAGSSFEFRASAPLFADIPFTLVGEDDARGVNLRAIRNDGSVAMSGRLE